MAVMDGDEVTWAIARVFNSSSIPFFSCKSYFGKKMQDLGRGGGQVENVFCKICVWTEQK